MKVKGASARGKVFAIGDCTDLPVAKLGYLANTMGDTIGKNITASAAGKSLQNIAPTPMAITVLPVGSKGGVSAMPLGFVMGDFVTRNVKASDLFVGQTWGRMNAGKPPVAAGK